ncbi:hypothetical protein POTOM_027020 [Populus tomentosa]|uniref:Protein RER1 n=1 Tax=Populus tomentosa TaxID=118781 RepID=A0A8X7ZKZ9_POPTO|nr:hypothetical protein POTOM_027020 [Populus tomentosa]
MEAGQPSGTLSVDDLSSLSSTPATTISRWSFFVSQRFQHFLDKTVPYILYRWIACLIVVLIYVIRVYLVQGFYIITYGLGIYLLNLLIGFLSPQIDPEIHDGPSLPTRGSEEFRPFVRRLLEFKFWYSITKAFCIAFVMTFFSVFDVPVFWPILLTYWVVLFVLTMRRQISHMIKYRYVPFSTGKQVSDITQHHSGLIMHKIPSFGVWFSCSVEVLLLIAHDQRQWQSSYELCDDFILVIGGQAFVTNMNISKHDISAISFSKHHLPSYLCHLKLYDQGNSVDVRGEIMGVFN